ncbi:MAG TPA: ATPase, T2SS/T4P/T4SS family [Pseudobacteroides sp.]|nr:ATPase, T2SS/T4P/T4SS family [Pseudobacteroides sp.]
MNKRNRKRLGDLLLEGGLISKEQLDEALEIQKKTGEKLGQILLNHDYVTQQDIIKVLEFQLGIPHVELETYDIDPSACMFVSESLAKRYDLIPIQIDNGVLIVAMSDPLNVFAIDDIKMFSGMEVRPVLATLKDINKAIDKYYSVWKDMESVDELGIEYGLVNIANNLDDEASEEINNSPAVKLLNSIIEQAISINASDIHIEPFEQYIKVRFRVDGQLVEAMRAEIEIMPSIVTSMKIISGLSIGKKRLPQDGRFLVTVNDSEYDLRVSILPTVYGEKIVIRITNKKNFVISKEALGFSREDLLKFDSILKKTNGIILIAGPTGSGKTTTLYSAISEMNKPDLNIVTIEDPVEYLIDGVNHVQVNADAGLSFVVGLRSILKQDPNIIMIGEIRDIETAEIAVKAAITGHLVLSTIHTNDAPETVFRLIDMGIEPFMVASSVAGVIAQRLVKKICPNCSYKYKASEEDLQVLGFKSSEEIMLYRGKGCTVCNKTGYKGRIGVYEIMTLNKFHRELINKGCSEDVLRNELIKSDMVTLMENVKRCVLEGSTTLSEMIRISHSNTKEG